ncbi:type I-C CRISPR-associated protein Cas7/Csd2 [Candidatus Fermentibacteria bacterium]|nr:type I-C CRISPR-associated protein Cas7/Csd2 [Candidatus Fermentibacteria bacterium]
MKRHDFVYVFDVKDGNPNGDPDAGNLPRVDPETGHGLVTDVCLKRKLRNYVALTRGDANGYRIYFSEGAVLNRLHEEAYDSIGEKPVAKKLPKDVEKARKLTEFMCQNFWDVRTFGAVMATEVNCGQVRGPIQMSFGRSTGPIVTLEHAITRSSVTNERDLEKERTMGRKFTVPYAVYVAYGFVNPFLARETGFSEEDLALLWESLTNAFQFDQSAARPAGSMACRRLIVFRHPNELGAAPSHALLDAVSVRTRDGAETPRSFENYEIDVDTATIPEGIEVLEMP